MAPDPARPRVHSHRPHRHDRAPSSSGQRRPAGRLHRGRRRRRRRAAGQPRGGIPAPPRPRPPRGHPGALGLHRELPPPPRWARGRSGARVPGRAGSHHRLVTCPRRLAQAAGRAARRRGRSHGGPAVPGATRVGGGARHLRRADRRPRSRHRARDRRAHGVDAPGGGAPRRDPGEPGGGGHPGHGGARGAGRRRGGAGGADRPGRRLRRLDRARGGQGRRPDRPAREFCPAARGQGPARARPHPRGDRPAGQRRPGPGGLPARQPGHGGPGEAARPLPDQRRAGLAPVPARLPPAQPPRCGRRRARRPRAGGADLLSHRRRQDRGLPGAGGLHPDPAPAARGRPPGRGARGGGVAALHPAPADPRPARASRHPRLRPGAAAASRSGAAGQRALLARPLGRQGGHRQRRQGDEGASRGLPGATRRRHPLPADELPVVPAAAVAGQPRRARGGGALPGGAGRLRVHRRHLPVHAGERRRHPGAVHRRAALPRATRLRDRHRRQAGHVALPRRDGGAVRAGAGP